MLGHKELTPTILHLHNSIETKQNVSLTVGLFSDVFRQWGERETYRLIIPDLGGFGGPARHLLIGPFTSCRDWD